MFRFSLKALGGGAAWLAVALLAGCQEGPTTPMGKVAGVVTLGDDPLSEGRINFVSDEAGVGASGDVQPDGTYTLEGPLPAGTYKVFITFEIAPVDRGTPAEDVLKSIPAKYQSQATTDLTADVVSETNECSFELETAS